MCAFELNLDMRQVFAEGETESRRRSKVPDSAKHRRIAEIACPLGARRGFAGGSEEAREDC